MDADLAGGPGVSYVMAIRRCDTFTMPGGEQQTDAVIAAVSARAWQKISAGAGAHGPREYHWARVSVPGEKPDRGGWLPAGRPRRNRCHASKVGY